MRKLVVLSMGLCVVLALTSCKSSESAYKKAYEKAKQQELAEPQVTEPVEVTSVTTAPVVNSNATFREEKVTVVSGDGLKDYSVICGSFGLKANAEGLKDYLDGQGYRAIVVFNPDKAMYRVVVGTYSDKASAAQARDAFKAKYPDRKDFQESWLLYRIY